MDRLIALWALIFVRPMLALGALVAVIGIGLVVFAGGYFALGAYEQAGLDDLAVTQAESGLTQADLTRDLATATALPAPTFTPAATATASPPTGNPADAAPRTPEIVPRTPTAEPTPEDSPLRRVRHPARFQPLPGGGGGRNPASPHRGEFQGGHAGRSV